MDPMTRREFVGKTAAGAAAAGFLLAGAGTASANPLGLPIGSQTYPHRQLIKDGNFADLLKTLKEIGVERIELCSAIGYADFANLADGKATKKALDDQGLKCESAHFSMKELRESQDKSIAWAKEIGITQMMTASLGDGNGGSNPTMDQVKKAADEYNKIAAVAAKAGIQQGLHNEGFELAMVDGKRVYDMLFDLLDPKLVKFQFQMSTITSGLVGADYFTQHPGRFISMHLQGVDLNAPAPTPGGPRPPNVAVGKDSLDWPKIFAAAKAGGVKNYFLEQSWDLTVQGVAYLKTLKV